MRSSTVTRSSLRSRQISCPYPTSTATTSRAPARSSTSVKPPVDAPASRQRRPDNSQRLIAGTEHLQRARQLVGASRGVARVVAVGEFDDVVTGDRPGRLVGRLPADADASGSDRR